MTDAAKHRGEVEAAMTKMDHALRHAYAVWRIEVQNAADAEKAAGVQARLASVIVDYTGDAQTLRDAGMQTGYDSGGRVSGSIPFSRLERLDAVPGVELIQLVPAVQPLLDTSIEEIQTPWKLSPATFPGKGAEVIVAIVDTGIDIFHESFRNNDAQKSTRILEIWDQGATAGGAAPPADFQQIGRVYTATDINNALAGNPTAAPTVDEDGHGTHVAGIAAGNGSQDDRWNGPGHYSGVAPEADLVIVRATDVDNGNFRDALRWCADAARRLDLDKPVVINCSFGSNIGPHDGTHVFDGFVDELLLPKGIAPPGLAIVAAAGNFGLDAKHEAGTVPATDTIPVFFQVPRKSKRTDILDIWYNGDATLTIAVIAPPSADLGSISTPEVSPGQVVNHRIGTMTLTVSSSEPQALHNGKRQINVSIEPDNGTDVRLGTWAFELTNTSGIAADWDAWFEHDSDNVPNFRVPGEAGGKPHRREDTIASPAMSRNAIAVAFYDDIDGTLSELSSRGRADQSLIAAEQRKPTIAAPGVWITAPRCKDGRPKRKAFWTDQKVARRNGSSMAAPHITGVVALMFEADPTMTFRPPTRHR